MIASGLNVIFLSPDRLSSRGKVNFRPDIRQNFFLHIIRYALCLSFWTLLVHSCQQYVTLHHVSKSISCYKAMCWYAHCFHDCIYITPILLLWDLSYYDKIDMRSVKHVLQTISFKKRSTIDAELWPVLGLVKKGRGLTENF